MDNRRFKTHAILTTFPKKKIKLLPHYANQFENKSKTDRTKLYWLQKNKTGVAGDRGLALKTKLRLSL